MTNRNDNIIAATDPVTAFLDMEFDLDDDEFGLGVDDDWDSWECGFDADDWGDSEWESSRVEDIYDAWIN